MHISSSAKQVNFIKKKITCLLIVCTLFYSCHTKTANSSWEHYKGSEKSIHYSSLTQVDTLNVKQLQVAWEYHTGDADTANYSQIQCNPVIIGDVLYGISPKMKLFAIDAATGKEKWQFNPFDTLNSDKKFFMVNNCRGVAYWNDGNNDKRIYYTAGAYLWCIDALTGKKIQSFADSGKLDLHEGLGESAKDLFVSATSPGVIFNDLIIMGTRVNESPQAAPGHIRAFNLHTGKLQWIFHTIPQPGEYGFDSWEDPKAYLYTGGANAWGGISLDKERGMVFACTGSSNWDWYGGRRKGNNLFADCLLALDAATGKRIWHFQDIHHDVWDRDLPSSPALITVNKNGKQTDAVAITTKTGFLFLFERTTGKPIYDIIEKPVPANSDLTGEQLSPTQPYPVKPAPFMRQQITEKDLNTLLPDSSYADVKKRWSMYKTDHMYNPPSLQGTLEFPGLDGGAEWGGPSFDPQTGILYINANEMAWIVKAKAIEITIPLHENMAQAGERLYQSNCMSCHGGDRKGSNSFPSLLNIQTKYSPSAFDTLIQSGRRMMPSFKQMPEPQRKAIASFILNITSEKKNPFTDTIFKKDDPFNLPYSVTGITKFLTGNGLPAISPPWGTLNAINVNTGEYVWKNALGNDPDFPDSKTPTGTENYGASVVTAGGLLFIAATKDGRMRAFNKRNGALLWEVKLPAAAFATPAVYELNGKQYLVIACGGGKMKTTSGDSYVAFTLPGR
ncbi:MAG: PQQ-binding-like beta-propeller repeat protein [Chitinophagaceae bacterium]